MRIIYVPLDERPCNSKYPALNVAGIDDCELVMPDPGILGKKKTAGDVEALARWLRAETPRAQSLILSLESLVYGGLLPSRIHSLGAAECGARLSLIPELKRANPSIEVSLFGLIMRTPSYSSAEEEPDYCAQYGAKIHRRAWLADKGKRRGLDESETAELARCEADIPASVIADYEGRRKVNSAVLHAALEYVQRGGVDYFLIPIDDSAPYGYSAIDQRAVRLQRRELGLQRIAPMHPGADEAGATLVARTLVRASGKSPTVELLYSSTSGGARIPRYEDRPLEESLVSQIDAAGMRLARHDERSDIILAVNAPGEPMLEAWDQDSADPTYDSLRHLGVFSDEIARRVSDGALVALADVAYSNGADKELVGLLDRSGALDGLASYAGWNTAGNTIGTALAQAASELVAPNEKRREKLLTYRLLEDCCYQSCVRQELSLAAPAPVSERERAEHFRSGGQIAQRTAERMREVFRVEVSRSLHGAERGLVGVSFPWNRYFEIDIDYSL
jgi:hypothetical protein